MAEGGQEIAGCPVCESMTKRQIQGKPIRIQEDIVSVPDVGKSKKKDIRNKNADRFLRYVNALLNLGAGFICLHVDNLHQLGMFEQSVNERMADLLPDDRPFHESFERNTLGKNHVIYRVLPGGGHLSTLSFNTKIPLDCSVITPTHGQMRHMMACTEGVDRGDPDQCPTLRLTFSKDRTVEAVQVKQGGETEESVFQESRSIQAKRVPPTRRIFLDAVKDFFQKDKKGTYLPKYVSAFTKLSKGGSIFLGMKEDKVEILKWTKVEEGEKNELLTLHKENLDLWQTRDGQYLVAESSPVEKEAQESGHFKCEGIEITGEERGILPEKIRRLIKENTYWHPDVPQLTERQVNVELHNVQGTEGFFVVEIQVRRYDGMVFLDKGGPVAYTFPKTDSSEELLIELTVEEWLEEMKD